MNSHIKVGVEVLTLFILTSGARFAMAMPWDYVAVSNGDSFTWTMNVSGSNIGINNCRIDVNVINNPIETSTNVSIIYTTVTSTNDSIFNATIFTRIGGLNFTITSMANASANSGFFIASNAQNKTYDSGYHIELGYGYWKNATYGTNGVLQEANSLIFTPTSWNLTTVILGPQSIPAYPVFGVISSVGIMVLIIGKSKSKKCKINAGIKKLE